MRCLFTALFPSNSLATTKISTCLPSPAMSATSTFWAWRASWILVCIRCTNSLVIGPSELIYLITKLWRTTLGLDAARTGCRGRNCLTAWEKKWAAFIVYFPGNCYNQPKIRAFLGSVKPSVSRVNLMYLQKSSTFLVNNPPTELNIFLFIWSDGEKISRILFVYAHHILDNNRIITSVNIGRAIEYHPSHVQLGGSLRRFNSNQLV